MTDLLPERPDPLDTLVPPLRRLGASAAKIKSFVVHWRTVLAGTSKRPCPFCYLAGGWGDLRPVRGRDDILYQCLECSAKFWTDGTATTA